MPGSGNPLRSEANLPIPVNFRRVLLPKSRLRVYCRSRKRGRNQWRVACRRVARIRTASECNRQRTPMREFHECRARIALEQSGKQAGRSRRAFPGQHTRFRKTAAARGDGRPPGIGIALRFGNSAIARTPAGGRRRPRLCRAPRASIAAAVCRIGFRGRWVRAPGSASVRSPAASESGHGVQPARGCRPSASGGRDVRLPYRQQQAG